MRLYKGICNTLAKVTTLEEKYIVLLLTSLIVIIIFRILKVFGKKIIQKVTTGRKEFVSNQTYQVILNALEILVFILLFDDYIKGLMTLISVISAAMTISLRDFILNFFCGVYIKSTGIVIHYPNSTIVSKPVKNINKGFKYIWNEMTIKVCLDCDLANNKKEIYKIVNGLDTVKSIPRKMKNLIDDVNTTNRIYFNKFEPIIYTRIVDDHIELILRYLMHPKKARYIESVIWNKIYLAYKDEKINLYVKD